MTTRAETIRGGDHRTLIMILAIGVQLALLGAYLGGRMITGDAGSSGVHAHEGSSAAAATTAGYGIASDVRTSFGSVVVGTAQSLPGLTRQSLAGANHGIGGYVPPDKVQVQVTVEISNRLRTPAPYSPSQFTLISGSGGKAIPVTGSSIKPATLLPDAAVEATLIFVAPRNGQKLQLAFQDRGQAKPFLINLGRVDTAPKDPDTHGHP